MLFHYKADNGATIPTDANIEVKVNEAYVKFKILTDPSSSIVNNSSTSATVE